MLTADAERTVAVTFWGELLGAVNAANKVHVKITFLIV